MLDYINKTQTANHAPQVMFIKTLITCLLLRKNFQPPHYHFLIKVANTKKCCKPQVQLTFLYRKYIIVKQDYCHSLQKADGPKNS